MPTLHAANGVPVIALPEPTPASGWAVQKQGHRPVGGRQQLRQVCRRAEPGSLQPPAHQRYHDDVNAVVACDAWYVHLHHGTLSARGGRVGDAP